MQEVGKELRKVNNLVRRYFESCPSRRIVESVSGTNGWIIGYLSDNAHRDVYQRDLEQEFGVTRSTASKVVSLMVQKGLIEHRPVPGDARLKKLVLTDRALEISSIMEEDGRLLEQRLTAGFTREELDTLYAYLDRMKQNMS